MNGSVPAQTVGRAALLLRVVASSHVQNLRLVDIAAMTSLDKSTAQRLLSRLVAERLLSRDATRGYHLGPLLYELGLGSLPETNLREISQAALAALAYATGDTIFLVVRSGFESMCLNRITGHYPIQTMTRTEGDRHPLGVGAGGLAILASLHDADIDAVLDAIEPRLEGYRLTAQMLRDAVKRTRERGDFSINEGVAAPGITAVGRTIHDRMQIPIAAVFVASISQRMARDRQEQICQWLVDCVTAIEAAMVR